VRARYLILSAACTLLIASDWPAWRGLRHDGVVSEEPKTWPEKLTLQWKTEVGIGHASPILAAGSIYDFARQGDQETIVSLDLSNGKIRWKQQYAAPFTMHQAATAHGEGPKSTPLYANGILYTLGISGILSAFDAETGKPLWRLNFIKQYKEGWPDFGTAASPIFENGSVIAYVGGNKLGALTAFDAKNGTVKWSWDGDSPAYATPIVVELGGVRQLVTQSRSNIVGVSSASGKLLWKIPFKTIYDQNIVTPVLYKDTLLFSGIDKGVFAVRLKRTGDTWSTQTVWQNKDASMYMNSPVLLGDLLLGFSNLKKGQLFCMDARTGSTLWTGPPRSGDNAAMLAGSTTLFTLTPDAQLIVAKPTAKGLGEVRRYEVATSPTWASPVVLPDGFLVKDLKTIARWSVN
jgi:outer membrane protein assembly factor BamB